MTLSAKKRARIEAMGGRVTTVEEWLDLTPEEVAIIDMKIRLGERFKAQRAQPIVIFYWPAHWPLPGPWKL